MSEDILETAKYVLEKHDLFGSQSGDEHTEHCTAYHTHCLIEGLVAEIAQLRDERRLRETLWQACAKHTRLVYGNVFVPKPLLPEPETKEVPHD